MPCDGGTTAPVPPAANAVSSSVRVGPSPPRVTTALAITVDRNGPGSSAAPAGLDDHREFLEATALTAEVLWKVDGVQCLPDQFGPVPGFGACGQLIEVGARRVGGRVAGSEAGDGLGQRPMVVGQCDGHQSEKWSSMMPSHTCAESIATFSLMKACWVPV